MKWLILDRDGVINYDSNAYIKSPEEWRDIPGSLEAIARLTRAGYRIGIASNQSGIARGYYSESMLAAIHQKMMLGVEAIGGRIDKIVYCPHLPDAGCDCRKPKPGMLYEIAQFFGQSVVGVPFIGDRKTDVLAARACGAQPILVNSPMTMEDEADLTDVPSYTSLAMAVDILLSTQHG